jgi:hypothetical protein
MPKMISPYLELRKVITEPDYLVITDGGADDLGKSGYYVWVGYKFASRTGRSDPKRMKGVQNKLYAIAKALADFADRNVSEVVVEDFTRPMDMYRLYITI